MRLVLSLSTCVSGMMGWSMMLSVCGGLLCGVNTCVLLTLWCCVCYGNGGGGGAGYKYGSRDSVHCQ